MPEAKRYMSPDGCRIIGTSDLIPGTALIHDIDYDGTPNYVGETDIDWNGQKTKTRGGKILFIDEDGEEWTFDELIVVPEDRDDQDKDNEDDLKPTPVDDDVLSAVAVLGHD